MLKPAIKPAVLLTRAIFPEVIGQLSPHFDVEVNDADLSWILTCKRFITTAAAWTQAPNPNASVTAGTRRAMADVAMNNLIAYLVHGTAKNPLNSPLNSGAALTG